MESLSTLRAAASIFSTATLRPVLSGVHSPKADAVIQQTRTDLRIEKSAPRNVVVQAAYKLISRNYRSEYVYRNLITSRYFIGRHKAANAVLLHELRLGESIADCVLVNGSGTVYEIKTERDDPSKLASQIASYRLVFPRVVLVVNHAEAQKYQGIAKDFKLGLVALNERGQLSERIRPVDDCDNFNLHAMFNLLRVPEITRLLEDWYGSVPEVPNGRRYETYLSMAEAIPVGAFQSQMQQILKTRKLRHAKPLLFNEAYIPFRAILTQLDPNNSQQEHFRHWLFSQEG